MGTIIWFLAVVVVYFMAAEIAYIRHTRAHNKFWEDLENGKTGDKSMRRLAQILREDLKRPVAQSDIDEFNATQKEDE